MFLYRMFGALVFDAGVFEDVEADARATWQATVVVVLSIGRAVAVCAIGAAVSAGMLFALGMAFSRVVS